MVESETNWSHIYDDLNSVGVFVADLFLVSMITVGILMAIYGIYLILTDDEDEHFMRIKGNVVESVCEKTITNKFKCTLTVNYEVDGNKYTKKLYQYDKTEQYMKDEPIDLIIAKSDHNIVKVAFKNMSKWGLTLTLMAIIIVGASYLNYYLAHNFKVYSVGQGIFVILNIFNSIFSMISYNNPNGKISNDSDTGIVAGAGVSAIISRFIEIVII